MAALHTTKALCPLCDRVLPAELCERGGDVFLELHCPEHGAASTLYFRDAGLYCKLAALRNPVTCCESFDCARGEPCAFRERRTMIYMLNVTNNCNMSCASCLSGALQGEPEPYAPAPELVGQLPDARRLAHRPHAVFFGGEPTMHPELASMIRRAAALGYVPRVATNGLALADPEYVRILAAAGLGWVFLHFDSLDDERNRHLRGRPMVQTCLAAMRNARQAGMRVQLGATVTGETLDEVGRLIRFAHDNGAFWISLYPAAEIERSGDRDGLTYLADLVNAVEAQTRGQVARQDFLACARLWSRLYRLTGRNNFRQKPTMLSVPLVVSGDELVPVNRLIHPLGAARRPGASARLIRALPSLWDYERRAPAPDTLVINIQQFQGRRAFDLEESVHSLMSYAHHGSWYAFDIYNHLHRWAAEAQPGCDRIACGTAPARGRE